jgi:predicted RNA-binding Zn ribbon-like protein
MELQMSSRLVDGVAVPLPVAGHPALDFCNTRAGWGTERPKEYLRDPSVLAIWAREAGLVTAVDATDLIRATEHRPQIAQALLTRALTLREALYSICLGTGDQAQWGLVGAEAATARARTRLVPGGAGKIGDAGEAGPAVWQPEWSGPEAAVLAVAHAAADLLTGPRAGTISACSGVDCGWLFSDPRGRRRWCEMAVCGNRTKARRHRMNA